MSSKAEIEITANTRRLPSTLRSALKTLQGFVHQATGLFDPRRHKDPDKQSLGFGGAAASFMGNVGANLAMRGLDAVISEGKKVFDFNKDLVRLGIDIRKSPKDMEAIGTAIRQVSSDTGIAAGDVLTAARAYVDLAGAESFTMDKMSLMSRAAQASGADVKDMAELLFTLTENMKVPPNELEATLSGLINQAKDGSIHFKELAHELVALGPVYTQFGVTGRQGSIQLGAMMQIARHGFGSASEAATGVLRILRSIPQHASKFNKWDIEIFKKGSKSDLQTFENIFDAIRKSKLQFDREALIKAFGRTEGERFYQLLNNMTGQYEKLKAAGQDAGTIQRDLATQTESAGGRMAIAVERMHNAFAEALTPERVDQIVGGIERIAGAMPAIVNAVTAVTDGFAGLYLMARNVKDKLTGADDYQMTDEEKTLVERGRYSAIPEVVNRRDLLLKKKEDYESEMEQIMARESPTGPSEGSIREALGAGSQKGNLTAGQEAAREAGLAYLKNRDVPDFVQKRVQGKIDRENKEVTDRATATFQAKIIAQAVKDGIRSALQPGAFGPMSVSFDANSGGKAIADAPNGRRK